MQISTSVCCPSLITWRRKGSIWLWSARWWKPATRRRRSLPDWPCWSPSWRSELKHLCSVACCSGVSLTVGFSHRFVSVSNLMVPIDDGRRSQVMSAQLHQPLLLTNAAEPLCLSSRSLSHARMTTRHTFRPRRMTSLICTGASRAQSSSSGIPETPTPTPTTERASQQQTHERSFTPEQHGCGFSLLYP